MSRKTYYIPEQCRGCHNIESELVGINPKKVVYFCSNHNCPNYIPREER